MRAPVVVERTFQLQSGVGPWRERDLWARGIADWSAFEAAVKQGGEPVMSKRLDATTLERIKVARAALAEGDLPALATLIPKREHWRLYPHFPAEAAFLDLEADGDNQITVAGVLDAQGPATFRRGKSLLQLPERLGRSRLWVTFNGGTFDLPVLRAHFPQLGEPAVHVDLRFVARAVKLKGGGLKAIEEALGVPRPPHLKGINGFDAIRLWREYHHNREAKALQILTEYNLYDAVNLRTLLEWSINRAAELNTWDDWERQPVFERGEVLYDISRLLLEQ